MILTFKYPGSHAPSFIVLNCGDILKLENFALIYLKSFQSLFPLQILLHAGEFLILCNFFAEKSQFFTILIKYNKWLKNIVLFHLRSYHSINHFYPLFSRPFGSDKKLKNCYASRNIVYTIYQFFAHIFLSYAYKHKIVYNITKKKFKYKVRK